MIVGSTSTPADRVPSLRVGERLMSEFFAELTPRRVQGILRDADRGVLGPLYALYERMETSDTRLGALVDQQEAALAGVAVKVYLPSEEGQEYGLYAQEVLRHLDVPATTRAFCRAKRWGASVYRIEWERRDYPYRRSLWFPTAVVPIDGRVCAADDEGYFAVYLDNGDLVRAEDLPLGAALFLPSGEGRGRWSKLGSLRRCVSWFVGVQYVQGWWVSYIEGYGSPMRIARHGRNVSDQERQELERFLRLLGQHGYGLFPNDIEVQLIEANRQGTITTYKDFLDKAHQEYAIALLGQADTVGSARGGSYARSVVSNAIRYDVLKDVSRVVGRGWTTLVEMGLKINYGANYDPRLRPTVTPNVVTPQDMKAKAEVAAIMQGMGVSVPTSYLYEQVLGVAPPAKGEEAVKYDTTYVVGEEEEPEPREVRRRRSISRDATDRSVGGDGNESYG